MKPVGLLSFLILFTVGFTLSGFATDTTHSFGKADEQRLVGRWVRPDGGYVIDIRSIKTEGKLDAAYFNPGTIHVERAEWRNENGTLSVFVVLRDTNYPGATYKLAYVPENDQLTGKYHQPFIGQTFDVYFEREKKPL